MSISYEWDELNRCSSIKSNPYSQSFIYNAVSNITSTTIADPEGSYATHFSYDDLNQIMQEKGHFNNTYIFDSLNNRRNKNGEVSTLDDLNRLTSDSINSYGSDKNGYRTSKNEFNYSYDALGRLISVSLNDDTITYSYDSFSRRLSRTSDHASVQYLYQFDTEIAALANNKIVEFKAIHGQFSPYAIELNDKVYNPIRNHRGDITVLLDSEQNAVSTYRYDAFGEFTHYGLIQSPWLFSSQRYDASTKNYHFINREYDSYTGRWLTPDPLGFEDGLNLYAYVHNNPMIYVDPYGLWGEGVYNYGRSVLASPRFHGACQMFGGAAEMGAGAAIAGGSGGLAAPIGFFAIGHGFDRFWTGTRQLVTGRQIDTATSQLMQQAGMSRQTANFVDDITTMGTTMGGTAVLRNAQAATSQLKYPQSTTPLVKEGMNEYTNLASKTRTNHILFGDANGGGHLYPGLMGKSPFPSSWNPNKIMHNISDIATDPNIRWQQISGKNGALFTKKGWPVRYEAIGIREGITIRTVVEPGGKGIITGYPIP